MGKECGKSVETPSNCCKYYTVYMYEETPCGQAKNSWETVS